MHTVTVPAAEFIEMAADGVAALDPQARADQLKELHEARGDQSSDFEAGYLLGLQTARAWLAMNPAAAEAGVKL